MDEEKESVQAPETGEETLYTVRHNKKEVKLTLGELLKNAEKGLDYDRIRPSHDFVKSLAKKSGDSDVSHFIATMKNEEGTADAETSQPQENTAETFNEKEVIAKEYPEFFKNGALSVPDDVKTLSDSGMSLLEAFHTRDLIKTKELNRELSAKLAAKAANSSNAAVALGSLSNGDTPEKSFYTSAEWDKLSKNQKEKFIKSGKIFEFMKKWSGK